MNSVIILCAGEGLRMKNKIPKQFLDLKGKMIFEYSIDVFLNNKNINEVILVCNKLWNDKINKSYKEINIINGGKNRSQSSFQGLLNCSKKCNIIHLIYSIMAVYK